MSTLTASSALRTTRPVSVAPAPSAQPSPEASATPAASAASMAFSPTTSAAPAASVTPAARPPAPTSSPDTRYVKDLFNKDLSTIFPPSYNYGLHPDVAIVKGKQYKIVATKPIPKRTVIVVEEPFLRCEYKSISIMDFFYTMRDMWSSYAQKAESKESQPRLHKMLHLYPRTMEDWKDVCSKCEFASDVVKSDANMGRILFKIILNAFIEDNSINLFHTISFFNHSCVNNCGCIGLTGTKATVAAVKDIAAGEELTINRLHLAIIVKDIRERRDFLNTRYFFTCACDACEGKTNITATNHHLNLWKESLIWYQELRNSCCHCNKAHPTLVCPRCKIVRYCSNECYTANAEKHNSTCFNPFQYL